MSDIDKLQQAEEDVAQREEAKRAQERQARENDLATEPIEETASRPRRSAHIALSDIVARDNIRLELPDVHELAISIRERGLITPLLLRPDETEGKFAIVAGHRRYAALQQLHPDGNLLVPAEVVDDLDEGEILALMLTENEQRVPLEPLQAARAARHLLDLRAGMTAAELARSLGLKTQWLVSRFKLLELPEGVQEQLEAGHLSFTIADLIRRAQTEGRIDKDKAKEIADKVVSGEMTAKQAKSEVAPNTPAPKTVNKDQIYDEEGNLKQEHWTKEIAEEAERRQAEAAGKKLSDAADDFLAQAEASSVMSKAPESPAPVNTPEDKAPDAERVHSSVDPIDEENPLRQRLHGYAVGRMLRDWASDEYLSNIGVSRDDAMEHAQQLSHAKRTELFYHLSAALMGADRASGK